MIEVSEELFALHDRFKLIMESAEPWDENFKFESWKVFQAKTWNPYSLFNEHCSKGPWRFQFNTLLAGSSLLIIGGNRYGRTMFDGNVQIPVLYEDNKLWMSMTPNEVLTLRPGVQRATGKVLIGGLGMGWLLKKVHEKPSVNEIIVVERNQSLLDWFGNALCATYPKVSQVICDDVFNQIGKHGYETRHLLDIWENFGTAYTDERYLKAKQEYKVWAWGAVKEPR